SLLREKENFMIKLIGLLSALLFVSSAESQAASGDQDFYKGKTIRIIVGFAAGGGFDVYARTVARHMPKHLPGNPSMIVDNMTGAGSRLAANYLYKASPRRTDDRQFYRFASPSTDFGRSGDRV